MNLHRAEDKPDWEKISKSNLNIFQKIAKKTNGFITPGNLITLAGLILVTIGSIILLSNLLLGTIFIIIGRSCDLIDGIIADRTQTKSPLGEMLDAGFDKIAIGICVLAIMTTNIIPQLILVALIIQNGINSFFSSSAKAQGFVIHPTRLGKITTALQWISLMLILASSILNNKNAIITTQALLIISIALGLITSVQYGKVYLNKRSK